MSVDKPPFHVIATSTDSVDGLVLALLGGGSQHSDPSRRMQTVPSFRIQQVVTRLLTGKVLRLRFEHDRLSVLGELQEQGAALTANELDLFMQADSELWWWTESRVEGTPTERRVCDASSFWFRRPGRV